MSHLTGDNSELISHAFNDPQCRNCGIEMTGKYCSSCGQKKVQRYSVKIIFTDTINHLSNLDFAIIRTIAGLSTKPGEVCREFILGRRTLYWNPVKYAIVMATAHVLMENFFHSDFIRPSLPMTSPEALSVFNTVHSFMAYLVLLVMFPVAFIQRLLFSRSPYNYIECYLCLMFIAGHLLLLT